MLDPAMIELFRLQADICKTLADPNRLMILHELRQQEKSVGQLTSDLGLQQSNVSRHLAVLRERSVVGTRRDGTTVFYRLVSPKIAEACDLVREVVQAQLAHNQALATSLRRASAA